jgi:hypothetical protein
MLPLTKTQVMISPQKNCICYHVKLGDFIARFYSYWDYQQAWFNAFFLQNNSWLFYFNNLIKTSNLPN